MQTSSLILQPPPVRYKFDCLTYLTQNAKYIDKADSFYEEVNESQAVYHFFLNLKPKSKQRRRLNRKTNKEYTPREYVQWQKDAKLLIQNQWRNRLPLSRVILIYCLHLGSECDVDADNLLGSPIDAMVKAKVLTNDNVKVAPTELTRWSEDNKNHRVYVDILINKKDNPNHADEIMTIPFKE